MIRISETDVLSEQGGVCFMGGFIILVLCFLAVCAAMHLKGNAWQSFLDDHLEKDKEEKKKEK